MAPSTLVGKNGLRFKAMRTALKTDPDWQTHGTNAAPPPLGVMESFASLRTPASSSSSLGGYLVLRRPGSQLRAVPPRARFPRRGQVLRGGVLIGGLVVASLYMGAFAHPDAPADVAAAQNKLRYAPQAARARLGARRDGCGSRHPEQ